MGGMIAIGLAFTAGFLAVYAVELVLTDLYRRDKDDMRRRMEDELRRQREASWTAAPVPRGLSELAEEAREETGGDAGGLWQRLRELTEQSGLDMTPRRLVAIAAGTSAFTGLLAALLTQSALVGGATGLLGAALPIMYVQFRRQQRLNLLRAQMPDAFDMMGRVLRAGQTMSQAMQTVADEFKPPIAREFGHCYEQQNLGLSPDFALRDLARRTGLIEMKVFVLAVLINRQTGGNLTELFEKLATVVRDRYRMRAKVQGLTAEGRFQALILLALPIVMYGVLLVVNFPYAVKFLDHPALPIGCLVSMTFGALWIRKIVNFDF